MASSSSLSCYHSLSLSEYFEMLRVVFFSLVSQWVVLVSCVYPMLRSGRLPLAPCQFVFSPSLWLTAYLSTVKVVHCAYCSTLCIHCQDDFFFRFSLSSYHSVVSLLPVAFSMCGVLSSSTTLSIHVLQIAFSESGRLPCGVPSVSSLTVHIVSRRVSKNQPQICISLRRNFVRMVYHTPVGYHNCQPWLAGSTLVVRD